MLNYIKQSFLIFSEVWTTLCQIIFHFIRSNYTEIGRKVRPKVSAKEGALGHSIFNSTHTAQNIAKTCQKYFQSFIAIEILPQLFCQLFQNISLQNYNFNFLKYFCK